MVFKQALRSWAPKRQKKMGPEYVDVLASAFASNADADVEVVLLPPKRPTDIPSMVGASVDSASQYSSDRIELHDTNSGIRLSAESPTFLEQHSKDSSKYTHHTNRTGSLEQHWFDAFLEPHIVSRDNSIYNYSTPSYEIQSLESDVVILPFESQGKPNQSRDDGETREWDENDSFECHRATSSSHSLVSVSMTPCNDNRPSAGEGKPRTISDNGLVVESSQYYGFAGQERPKEDSSGNSNVSGSNTVHQEIDNLQPCMENVGTSTSSHGSKNGADVCNQASKSRAHGKWRLLTRVRNPGANRSYKAEDDRTRASSSTASDADNLVPPFAEGDCSESAPNEKNVGTIDGHTKSKFGSVAKWQHLLRGDRKSNTNHESSGYIDAREVTPVPTGGTQECDKESAVSHDKTNEDVDIDPQEAFGCNERKPILSEEKLPEETTPFSAKIVPSIVGSGDEDAVLTGASNTLGEDAVSCLTPYSASIADDDLSVPERYQRFRFWKRNKRDPLVLERLDEEASSFSFTPDPIKDVIITVHQDEPAKRRSKKGWRKRFGMLRRHEKQEKKFLSLDDDERDDGKAKNESGEWSWWLVETVIGNCCGLRESAGCESTAGASQDDASYF